MRNNIIYILACILIGFLSSCIQEDAYERAQKYDENATVSFYATPKNFVKANLGTRAGEGEEEDVEDGTFKVLYSEDCSDLLTHEYYWEDGEPAVLPVEEMGFEEASENEFGFKLLGMPAMTEGYENENEGLISLLQLDEEERWGLRFFDCGTVNFMISAERQNDDFSNISFCMHSS